MWEFLKKFNSDPGTLYIFCRTIFIYMYAIFLLRTSNRRFRLETPVDLFLFIIMGGILGGTLTGVVSVFATILTGQTLIILHWFFAKITFRSITLDRLIKGSSILIIKNGQIVNEAINDNLITVDELRELCRKQLKTDDLSKVKKAYLERTGNISFLE